MSDESRLNLCLAQTPIAARSGGGGSRAGEADVPGAASLSAPSVPLAVYGALRLGSRKTPETRQAFPRRCAVLLTSTAPSRTRSSAIVDWPPPFLSRTRWPMCG